MNAQPPASRTAEDRRLQRAIVLQLLRPDHPPEWSAQELAEELQADAHAVQQAVSALTADGVICSSAASLSASRAILRLDELELIGL
jgi:DNA-binding GntR family transcriptional regulator